MKIMIFITDDFSNKEVCTLTTEHALIPNVNDTISLTKKGEFIVARREFVYNIDYALDYVELKVHLKPKNKEV